MEHDKTLKGNPYGFPPISTPILKEKKKHIKMN